MLKKLPKENMGTSNLGWLESRFHFSVLQNIEIQVI
jgi:quercetin 2,3-dioxygenase